MLINKWLVTDSVLDGFDIKVEAGLCIHLNQHIKDRRNFFRFVQKEMAFTPLAVILFGDEFNAGKVDSALIEDIIAIFFQPSYYMVDYHPILFLKNATAGCRSFIASLQEKSIKQGLKSILVQEIQPEDYIDSTTKNYNYWLKNEEIDFEMLIKRWLSNYLEKKKSSEIHLLIPAISGEAGKVIEDISRKEEALTLTEHLKLANILYEQQQLIEYYKHQLSLKAINEKNNQLYLSIQKEERANALKWYYYEYEVLPLWYKQFGHIIKVITGKRTFRSLFNDSVKKHRD